jgi:hypothetical protein
MKVTKIKKGMVNAFITKLTENLKELRIDLYDVECTSTSVKFRAERDHNLLYAGGGMRNGQPIRQNAYYTPKLKQAKYLHYEEWALVNDAINEILDDLDGGGSCLTYFDGERQYIRENGEKLWSSEDHI